MGLLRLPNEILLAIADHLMSLVDINAFAQTNHRCYAVLNRQLYVYATKEANNPGFLWAVESGRSKTVQYFLDAAETIQIPLEIAARHGYPRRVTLLIMYGSKLCDNMKLYCQAALAVAVKCGRVKVAKVLLDNGVDLEYAYEYGMRPLHIGIMAVELLLEHGANPNGKDPNSEMPLHLAARDKSCEIAESLIKKGACLETRDCHGQTPIDWALSYGSHEIIHPLRDKGASVGSLDWSDGDPVFRALGYGHIQLPRIYPCYSGGKIPMYMPTLISFSRSFLL
ncbi:hypothetical protein N7463_005612 [Penicillium fimorum]|uniref:F-box domain-containing protein n=1 Tax=Penicillium fimorum TaxID=1882269 RepID=A0A9W9XSV9_9EURO|nr:hypothetical protein N7463_005612 [Penicillium fimorum]